MFAFVAAATLSAACGGASPSDRVSAAPAPEAYEVQASALADSWTRVAAVAVAGESLWLAGTRRAAGGATGAVVPDGGDSSAGLTLTGTGPVEVTAIAAAPSSVALFATGRFTGTVAGTELSSGGPGAAFVARLEATSSAPQVEWAIPVAGPGYAHLRDVAATTDGGAIAAGYFSQEVTTDGAARMASGGSQDALVLSIAGDGRVRWSRRLGGPGPDYAHAVAVAADGDVLVAGGFAGPVDFGDQVLRSINDTQDGFIARLAADDGATKWSIALGSGFDDAVYDLAITDTADVLAAGTFAGTGLLGGPPVETRGGDDVFVVAVDATGAHRWQQTLGSGGDDDVTALAVTAAGLVVGGSFPGPLYAGPNDEPSFAPAGERDAYLVTLGASGTVARASRLGGPGLDHLTALAADKDFLYAAGSFEGRADLLGRELTQEQTTPGPAIFVVRQPLP